MIGLSGVFPWGNSEDLGLTHYEIFEDFARAARGSVGRCHSDFPFCEHGTWILEALGPFFIFPTKILSRLG